MGCFLFTICFFDFFPLYPVSLYYETIALCTYTYGLAAHITGQVKRLLWFALFGYLQTVCCYPCFERFFDLFCCPKVPVCRYKAFYALVRTLEVVVVYKMTDPLSCSTVWCFSGPATASIASRRTISD